MIGRMKQHSFLQVIDSHTEGEPTRVVVEGGPSLDGLSMPEAREALRREHDWVRTTCISEPRGFDAIVGAVLCESEREDCEFGVVFFNNVGYLNGCIHGTIGLAQTLVHLGKIGVGDHGLETVVGKVTIRVEESGMVAVENVRSYRDRQQVEIQVDGYGTVVGDIAWGGNWFFLVNDTAGIPLETSHIAELTQFTTAIRRQLIASGITGRDGMEIDHIEIFGPPADPQQSDSKNFVLCPGGEFDRSPCGTGTSAKLSCLHADGRLQPGELWRQSGILNSVFYGTVQEAVEGGVIPTVKARAFITGENRLIRQSDDPFRDGIPY